MIGDRIASLRWRPVLLPVIAGAILIAAWSLAVRTTGVSSATLPGPGAVFARWAEILHEPDYYRSIGVTLRLAGLGLAIGTGVGVAIGSVAGMWRPAREAVWPFVQAVRVLPAVGLIPVVLVLVPGEMGRPLIIGISCTAVVAVSCGDGWKAAARERIEFAATAGLGGWRLFALVYLPEAGRELAVGVRIAAGLALTLATVIEMLLGQSLGLGTYISMHGDTDRAAVFAVVGTLAVLGVVINLAIEGLSHSVLFWQR
jgi:NitT/TauT family transport system permease protein